MFVPQAWGNLGFCSLFFKKSPVCRVRAKERPNGIHQLFWGKPSVKSVEATWPLAIASSQEKLAEQTIGTFARYSL
jgi:hypothetical protein